MLVIEVISVQGRPAQGGQAASFGAGGGTIGRGSGSTLVLPDTKRHISRTQATIECRAGGFVLTDVGTLNPVSVNGRALGSGVHARLVDGDELAIGDYTLRVRLADGEAPRPVSTHAHAGERDPFDALPAQSVSDDPFAEPLPRDHPLAASGRDAPGRDSDSRERDPLEDTLPSRDWSASGPQVEPPVAPTASEDSIDFLFGIGRIGPVDPLAPGAPLSDRAAPDNGFRGAVPNHGPEIESAYEPPPALPPAARIEVAIEPPRPARDTAQRSPHPMERAVFPAPEPGATPSAAPPAAAPARPIAPQPGHDALLEAFLRGAAVPSVRFPTGLTPELMEVFGRLLREAVQGTLDLLAARARIKNEMRAELTMIEPRNNNPLKFSPTADAALTHLLEPRGQGFLTPVRALRNAFDDLRAHQLAMMAGMRAALSGLLERFEPQELEKRLREKSVLDNLLPMHRKARQWDLFTELYAELSREAEEDFHVAFGKEFRKAYEAQMQRVGRTASDER